MKKIVVLVAALFCNAVMAQAQDEVASARNIEADYKDTAFFVEDVDCADNPAILESAPEIAYVTFRKGYSRGCEIHILHKTTYKIIGKTFHLLNRNQLAPKISTFVVEKKEKK